MHTYKIKLEFGSVFYTKADNMEQAVKKTRTHLEKRTTQKDQLIQKAERINHGRVI